MSTDWRTDPEVVAAREKIAPGQPTTKYTDNDGAVHRVPAYWYVPVLKRADLDAYDAAVERAVLKAQPCYEPYCAVSDMKGAYLGDDGDWRINCIYVRPDEPCVTCKARAEGATG